MAMDWLQNIMGGGMLAGGLGSLFGGQKDPTKDAMGYLQQIPSQTAPFFGPYYGAGLNSLGQLQGQYGNLLQDPGARLNQIGAGYKESPGFKFALQQALSGANQASAAGGMAGSPQSQQQNMELATQLANQDYNNWLQQATGLYGAGLQGAQGLAGMGQQAGRNYANLLAQSLADQAKLKYSGNVAQNQNFGSGLGMLGSGLGMLFGGPFGGALGNVFGNVLGGK